MKFLFATPFKTVYSQIDLKDAIVYVKDGYGGATGAKVGAINQGGGYAAASTILTVDVFTAAVSVGDIVTIAGSLATGTNRLTRHTITAHTETTGATTSITVNPALDGAVLDDAVITVQPHQLEVKIGTGNLTYTEKRNIDYTLNRGLLDTTREGDQVPVEVKMDFTWDFLRGDTSDPPTVEDALKRRGNASAWVSSETDDTCAPFAVDIEVWYNPPCSGVKDEVILLENFRWEQLDHNLKDGTVSISGKCNITEATVSRV